MHSQSTEPRDELLRRAAEALAKAHGLRSLGVERPHPGYDDMVQKIDEATSAGISVTEIYAAISAPQ